MPVNERFLPDVETILSHRYDGGADFWTTPDHRLLKGTPFSALDSALLLLELGVEPDDPMLKGVAELFLAAWKPDGRFKLYPTGSIFPCQTVLAAHLLCLMGYAKDPRLQATFRHLLETRHSDGGWRCKKYYFGRGPETECSNPFPTITALRVLLYSGIPGIEDELAPAVDFLLEHWVIRKPIGPCHYGMGTRFMQVEYPFGAYNLFWYVYVLSFFPRARRDARFGEALLALQDKLVDGQIVVERISSPKLAKLLFCEKGKPSELATKRYLEIVENLKLDA